MKYFPRYNELNETYKLDNLILNGIPDEKDTLDKKLVWSRMVLSAYLKKLKQQNYKADYNFNSKFKLAVYTLGAINQIIWGIAKKEYPHSKEWMHYMADEFNSYARGMGGHEFAQDFDPEEWYKRMMQDPKFRLEMKHKELGLPGTFNTTPEKNIAKYYYNNSAPTKKAAKNPIERFNKIFPDVIICYNRYKEIIIKEKKYKDFFDRVSGQSSAHLKLEDQMFVLNNINDLPEYLSSYIFGATYDKCKKIFNSDLMEEHMDEMPQGRILETAPELYLLFIKTTLNNSIVLKYLDKSILNKYTKEDFLCAYKYKDKLRCMELAIDEEYIENAFQDYLLNDLESYVIKYTKYFDVYQFRSDLKKYSNKIHVKYLLIAIPSVNTSELIKYNEEEYKSYYIDNVLNIHMKKNLSVAAEIYKTYGSFLLPNAKKKYSHLGFNFGFFDFSKSA